MGDLTIRDGKISFGSKKTWR